MKTFFALCISLLLFLSCTTTRRVPLVAHRGYWKAEQSYENTLSSLENAMKLNIYGSECDVRNTLDGRLVMFHNAGLLEGAKIETLSYDSLSTYRLPNGEKIPTLEEYLQVMKDAPRGFVLVIEVKQGSTKDIVAAVEQYGMEKRVEYISFSNEACKELISMNKGLKVSLLAGDEKSALTPTELKSEGYYGLDYYAPLLKRHLEWIEEAHALGLDVNVWTVDEENEIKFFLQKGVNKVTTNVPNTI